LWTALGNIL